MDDLSIKTSPQIIFEGIYYAKKMSATPEMATIAPKNSLKCTVSFLTKIATGINNTGVIEVSVDATPGLVCCIASNDNEMPKNGPKKEPSVIYAMACFSLNASKNDFQLPLMVNNIVNPMIPAMSLICVAAKAS